MRGDEELLCSRIPEAPRLCALRVPDENALARVWLQRLAVLLAHEHVGQTAKDAEVGDIRLLAGPKGDGAFPLETFHRLTVVRMYSSVESELPKSMRKASKVEHA